MTLEHKTITRDGFKFEVQSRDGFASGRVYRNAALLAEWGPSSSCRTIEQAIINAVAFENWSQVFWGVDQ